MNATLPTSAAAGAWSGVGMASAQAWLDRHHQMTTHSEDLLLLLAFVAFVALPAYLFVFGKGVGPFRRDDVSDPAQRARRGSVFKRVFIWLVCAGVTGTAWSF